MADIRLNDGTIIVGGASPPPITVDQTYDPSSTDPQSGTAVAEAITEHVGIIEIAGSDNTFESTENYRFADRNEEFTFNFTTPDSATFSVDFTVETGFIGSFAGSQSNFAASNWTLGYRATSAAAGSAATEIGTVTQGQHTGNFTGIFTLTEAVTSIAQNTEYTFVLTPGVTGIVIGTAPEGYSIRVHESYAGAVQVRPGSREAIDDISDDRINRIRTSSSQLTFPDGETFTGGATFDPTTLTGDITVTGLDVDIDDDTIGVGELSATGNTDATTFLRGDNTWAVPPGTDLSASSIDALSDVDTTTVAPTDGQALVWNTAGQWEPGTVGASITDLSQLPEDGATTGQVIKWSGTEWEAADDAERDIDLAYYHAHTSITQDPLVQRANSISSSHTFRGGASHTNTLAHNIGTYSTPSTGTFTVRLSGYLTQFGGFVRGSYQVRLVSVSGSATNDDHIVLGRTSASSIDSAGGIFFDDTTVTIGTDVDASTEYYLQVDAANLVDGESESFSFVAHFDHEEGGVVATPEFDTYVDNLISSNDINFTGNVTINSEEVEVVPDIQDGNNWSIDTDTGEVRYKGSGPLFLAVDTGGVAPTINNNFVVPTQTFFYNRDDTYLRRVRIILDTASSDTENEPRYMLYVYAQNLMSGPLGNRDSMEWEGAGINVVMGVTSLGVTNLTLAEARTNARTLVDDAINNFITT